MVLGPGSCAHLCKPLVIEGVGSTTPLSIIETVKGTPLERGVVLPAPFRLRVTCSWAAFQSGAPPGRADFRIKFWCEYIRQVVDPPKDIAIQLFCRTKLSRTAYLHLGFDFTRPVKIFSKGTGIGTNFTSPSPNAVVQE